MADHFTNAVRLVSDGTPNGTKVLTKSGEEIVCKAIRFSHNAGAMPVLTLELIAVEVEIAPPVGGRLA